MVGLFLVKFCVFNVVQVVSLVKIYAGSKNMSIFRLQSDESDGNHICHGYNRSIDPLVNEGCKSQRYKRGYTECLIYYDRSYGERKFLFDSIVMYLLDLNLYVDVV